MSSNSKILSGLLIVSFALVLIVGSTIAFAHNGDSTSQSSFVSENEVTLKGIIESIDDDGFILVLESQSVYIHVPHMVNIEEFNLVVNEVVTVTAFPMDVDMHQMMGGSQYMDFNTELAIYVATSINGIIIDHQTQGQCGGNGSHSGMGMGNGFMGMNH